MFNRVDSLRKPIPPSCGFGRAALLCFGTTVVFRSLQCVLSLGCGREAQGLTHCTASETAQQVLLEARGFADLLVPATSVYRIALQIHLLRLAIPAACSFYQLARPAYVRPQGSGRSVFQS